MSETGPEEYVSTRSLRAAPLEFSVSVCGGMLVMLAGWLAGRSRRADVELGPSQGPRQDGERTAEAPRHRERTESAHCAHIRSGTVSRRTSHAAAADAGMPFLRTKRLPRRDGKKSLQCREQYERKQTQPVGFLSTCILLNVL